MSAEASGPAAAEALSLEVPKPWGFEPGSAAEGLRPQTPNSKYVKLNVGGSLHYTTLRTLTGQDTMLKTMFSGRAEVLTDAGGTAMPVLVLSPILRRLTPSLFLAQCLLAPSLFSLPSSQVILTSTTPHTRSHLPFFIHNLLPLPVFTPSNNLHHLGSNFPSPTLPGAVVSDSTCRFRIFIITPTQFSHPSPLSSGKLGNQPCCQQHPSRPPSSVFFPAG